MYVHPTMEGSMRCLTDEEKLTTTVSRRWASACPKVWFNGMSKALVKGRFTARQFREGGA